MSSVHISNISEDVGTALEDTFQIFSYSYKSFSIFSKLVDK